MSIKNKLVTAITTAGLLAGLFGSAFVPAAKAANISDMFACNTALNNSTSACSTTIGSQITFNPRAIIVTSATTLNNNPADDAVVYIEVSGATILSVTGAESATATEQIFQYGTAALTDGDVWASDGTGDESGTDADGLIYFVADDEALDVGNEVKVYRTTAGSATVTAYYYSSGIKKVMDTATLSWSATAGAGKAIDWNSANTVVTLVPNDSAGAHADCVEGTTTKASANNLTSKTVNYDATVVADLCIILTDVDGAEIEDDAVAGAIDITVTSSSGMLDIGNDGTILSETFDDLDNNTATFDDGTAANTASDGDAVVVIEPDGDAASSTTTITVKIEQDDATYDVETSKTFTFTVKLAGDLATITLTNIAYSLDDDAAADVDAIVAVGKDANGIAVDMSDADFDLSADATDLIVDSTFTTAVKSVKGTSDAAATVVVNTENATDADAKVDANEAWISVDCADASAAGAYEKLTIKLSVENEAEVEVVSASVTIYCANNLVTSLTVKAGASAGTYVATALDANGYPVADGEVITALAANGSWFDSTVETENGESEFSGVGISGTVTVVAESGAYEKTASISGSGTLTAGPKGLKATAAFGTGAGGATVIFTVERVSTGTVTNYYRKANASGVATFTLRKRGTFEVTAVFGDSITDTVTLKK